MQPTIASGSKKTGYDELNYIASIICQTLKDLEVDWKSDEYFRKTIIHDKNVKFVMQLKDKWANLFLELKK